MNCSHCGTAIPDNAAFCTRCGLPVSMPTEPIAVNVTAFVDDSVRTGRRIMIGDCLSRAWAFVKTDYGTLLGITFLAMLCSSVIILNFIVFGGIAYYYLGRIRGQQRKLEDIFAGFQRMTIPLILGGLVMVIPVFLAYMLVAVFGLVGFGLGVMNNGELVPLGILIGGFGVLAALVVVFYFGVSWMFVFHLIIDKRLKFWDAMEVSRRVVARQFWKVLALCLVFQLIMITGLVCCYVGAFLIAPVNFAALAFAYEDLFHEVSAESHAV